MLLYLLYCMSRCFSFSLDIAIPNKQIHFVDERFTLNIHKKTTNYSYIADVSVSIRDLHHLIKVSDGDRNVSNARIIGCVLMNF